jgi:Protein of unknown function (DUF3102)
MARRKKTAEVVQLHGEEEVERFDDGPAVPLEFDYETIEPEHRGAVMHAAVTIKLCAALTVRASITIGQQLVLAKEHLKHGMWIDWLKSEFGWTVRTAQRHMSVAEMIAEAKNDNLSLSENFGLSAAYLLARNSTPADVRKEALKLLIKGERVTRKMVIAMLGVPEEAKLPKEEKHTDIRPGPVDPEADLMRFFSAWEHMQRNDPAEVAASVPSILRQRYHDECVELVEWAEKAAAAMKELGYVEAA